MQTTYSIDQAAAKLGQLADAALRTTRRSCAANGNVHVGALVAITSAATTLPPATDQCADLTDSVGTVPTDFGIALREDFYMPYGNDGQGNAVYVTGQMIPVLTHGTVWMNSETACADGDPVYVRNLASGAAFKGQVRNSAATNFILVPNAKFTSALAAAGLAKVELL